MNRQRSRFRKKRKGEHTDENLNETLLYRSQEGLEVLLVVNFYNMLIRLLIEVKYLRLFNYQVPRKVQRLYDKVDTYRAQTSNIELIVTIYNEILKKLLPVE